MHDKACNRMCVRVCVWRRDECVIAGQFFVCMFEYMHTYVQVHALSCVYVCLCVWRRDACVYAGQFCVCMYECMHTTLQVHA